MQRANIDDDIMQKVYRFRSTEKSRRVLAGGVDGFLYLIRVDDDYNERTTL